MRWSLGSSTVSTSNTPFACIPLTGDAGPKTNIILKMKKNVKWFAAALVALTLGYGAVSCGSDSKEPEWEWPDPDPDPDPQQYVISDTQVSSTCELLYIVMSQIWGKEIVTPDIAGALYTGINTDTGGLSHNSSHPQTYRIIADLLEAGLDKAYIHERIYQMNNLSRLRLIGNVLLNKLEVNEQYPVAIMPITREELDRYNYKDGDLEGLVNIPLSVHNVCVSVQITERRERVKLSFRSKGNVPVNEWAKAFFNGGGHLNAAGGQMDLPLAEVVRKVKETIPWFFEQLKNSGI
jgi:phosphoesterase RecJ-like protein